MWGQASAGRQSNHPCRQALKHLVKTPPQCQAVRHFAESRYSSTQAALDQHSCELRSPPKYVARAQKQGGRAPNYIIKATLAFRRLVTGGGIRPPGQRRSAATNSLSPNLHIPTNRTFFRFIRARGRSMLQDRRLLPVPFRPDQFIGSINGGS